MSRLRAFRPSAVAALSIAALVASSAPASAAPDDPLYDQQYGPQQVHASSACTCWGPYCWSYSGSSGAALAGADDATRAAMLRAATAEKRKARNLLIVTQRAGHGLVTPGPHRCPAAPPDRARPAHGRAPGRRGRRRARR